MVYAVAWLFLLSHAALAKIVDDSSTDISYSSGVWTSESKNGYYSGETAHHTNISGATANYSFTGVAVTLYGLLQDNGANFSLTVGDFSQNCTSRQNKTNTWSFGSELCSMGDLDGTVQSTLVIRHTDPRGGWLTIDYLDVALVNPTTVVTSAASPTTPPIGHFWTSRPKLTTKIKYGLVGLFVGLVVATIIVSSICQCCCRGKKPSFTITAN